MHGQIAAVRGYSLRLPQCCEAKYSWKETFGEVICKLNPKSVESKVYFKCNRTIGSIGAYDIVFGPCL